MLQYIHVGPIAKVEAIAVQGYPMEPGWDDRGHRLVIDWQPTNFPDGNLLCLIIQLDASIARILLRLADRLRKRRIVPLAAVVARVWQQVQCQPVIRIGKVRAPLGKAKLHLVIGCLCIIRG